MLLHIRYIRNGYSSSPDRASNHVYGWTAVRFDMTALGAGLGFSLDTTFIETSIGESKQGKHLHQMMKISDIRWHIGSESSTT